MPESSRPSQPPIAVIGLSTLVPGSADVAGFWRDLVHARDLIRDVPETHWLVSDHYSSDPTAPDKTYGKRGAFMSPVAFDPLAFGTPPSTIDATDTAQLLSLIAAERVLRDACGEQGPSETLRERTGIILGASPTELAFRMSFRSQRPTWRRVMLAGGVDEHKADELCDAISASYPVWKESSFPGMLTNVIAGRVARHFDLHGSNYTTDAACASSLSAMSAAIDELTLGRADMMITGGVDPLCDAFGFTCFSKTPALSPSGECRPFSAEADGTLLGEAVAMVMLKRLADAERDGDRVYAVIRGVGTSSDGRGSSIYAPAVAGQVRALHRAYASAGYSPATVELIEAHGTGTKAGDTAEVTALQEVFGTGDPADIARCALGSVKSQIGHTRTAAGAVGLAKAALALHHKILPPTLKADRADPALELEKGPFYLSTRTRPWIRGSEHPRRASVSSFGFGGTNFHVTLEEHRTEESAPAVDAYTRTAPSELVLLGAESGPALVAALDALTADTAPLHDLARRTQLAFEAAAKHRLCLVARDEDELRAQASDARRRISAEPQSGFHTPAGMRYACGAASTDKIALLFPGQGSQYPDMGIDVVLHQPRALAAWDAVADFAIDGRPLHRSVFPPPVADQAAEREHAERLKATECAQPALAAHALMIQEILGAVGFVPDCVAGHSFGELSALHAAGVYDDATLMSLARARGELLRDASKVSGAMLAVTASSKEADDLVRGIRRAWVANYNSPTQHVISGAESAIAKVEQRALEQQLPTQRLAVSCAFHSPLLQSATSGWRPTLEQHDFTAPRLPVYGNADAKPYPDTAPEIRTVLRDHVTSSVRFAEMILAMHDDGVRTFVEAGPGTVLTGLVGRILADRPHVALSADQTRGSGLTALHRVLGALAVAGRPLDFAPLWAAFTSSTPSPSSTRTGMTIPISGPNPDVGHREKTPAAPAVRESAAGFRQAGPPTTPTAPVAAVHQAPPPTPAAVTQAPPPALVQAALPPAAVAPYAAPEPVTQYPAPAPVAQYAPTAPVAQYAAPAPVAPAAPVPAPVPVPAQQTPAVPVRTYEAPVAEATTHDVTSSGSTWSPVTSSGAWLHAFLEVQRQASDAHSAYQSTTSASHASYLDLARTSLDGLMAWQPGAEPRAVAAPAPAPAPALMPAPAPLAPAPQALEARPHTPREISPAPAAVTQYPPTPVTQARPPVPAAQVAPAQPRPPAQPAAVHAAPALRQIPAPTAAPAPALTSAPAPAPVAAPAAPAQESGADVALAIVAELTGYPVEMLTPDMDLEVDLGVDSIKRVQILTRLRDHFPDEANVDPADLARLRTIAAIADKITSLRAPNGATPQTRALASVPAPALAPLPESASAPAQESGADVALAIVAELTGYPVEMLTPDMDLEVDLGVDSIKRVQILTRLRDHFPDEANVDPADLARLRTIAAIADKITSLRAPDVATPQTPAPVAPAAPAARAQEQIPAQAKHAAPQLTVLRTGTTLVPTEAANGGPLKGLREQPLLITDDGTGVAECLAETLRREGIKVSVTDRVTEDSTAVIVLAGLREIDPEQDPDAPTREVFTTLHTIAEAMERRGGVLVVVQDTGGAFGTSGIRGREGCAGIAALARTAANEWAHASIKTIDIERAARAPQDLAQAIATELLHGDDTTDVALTADGSRALLRGTTETLGTPRPLDLGPDPVIVVTGGARGITASCLIALAGAHRPKFLLLGRTRPVDEDDELRGAADETAIRKVLSNRRDENTGATPTLAELAVASGRVLASREIRTTLDLLAVAGAETRYVTADATDRERVFEALAEVRRDWGPITGIIHAAGVIADSNISDKTQAQFTSVYDTKVRGFRTLLELTDNDPVRLVCAFSSVSARLGTAGQSDYAAANQAMEQITATEAAHRPECTVRAVAWGPWAAGMVSPAHAEHFRRLGVPLLEESAGVQAFMTELEQSGPACVSIAAGAAGPAVGTDHGGVTEILVGADTHPYLVDHSIAGRPVVPVALVLEWFARAARTALPDQDSVLVRDLRVLRAVALDKFGVEETRLRVHARPDATQPDAPLRLELKSADGALHYAALAGPGEVATLTAPAAEPVDESFEVHPGSAVYDGAMLFHGPLFHAITTINGLSSAGATCDLVGLRQLGWAHDAWQTDPLVLDGALQAACLWVLSSASVQSLPMGVREVRVLSTGAVDTPVKCTVHSVMQGTDNAICDIWLTTEHEGAERVLGVLAGVEMVYRPDLSSPQRTAALISTDA
ncbi:SDR family NAD(P)-dependent oxidoreductase [Embleya sp. NPDC127516]|uniref:SDR family NAD(P)-dependent oxidoreductase n=1 Tax=Embleya sp. NPDC127516 TaxID=3363990 RepID=UPI00380EE3C1